MNTNHKKTLQSDLQRKVKSLPLLRSKVTLLKYCLLICPLVKILVENTGTVAVLYPQTKVGDILVSRLLRRTFFTCVRDNSKTLSQIPVKLATHMYLG